MVGLSLNLVFKHKSPASYECGAIPAISINLDQPINHSWQRLFV
jgi:hypothetical protein